MALRPYSAKGAIKNKKIHIIKTNQGQVDDLILNLLDNNHILATQDALLRKKPVYKIDLIEYALQRSIPLDKTRTCFGADETADGTCFACQKRLAAFNYIGIKDPLKYQRRDYNEKRI